MVLQFGWHLGGDAPNSIISVDYNGYVGNRQFNGSVPGWDFVDTSPSIGLRPVVCLSSKVPAKIGTTYDYEI